MNKNNWTNLVLKLLIQQPNAEAVVLTCSAKTVRPATLLIKRLWRRCFRVNFEKFLRAPFFIGHLRRLLLLMLWNQACLAPLQNLMLFSSVAPHNWGHCVFLARNLSNIAMSTSLYRPLINLLFWFFILLFNLTFKLTFEF